MKIKIIVVLFSALLFLSCEKMLVGPEPDNNPKSNFEILWKAFDENYALFPVKKVNWDSLRVFYGSQINSTTSESGLWNIFDKMLSELNDGHVSMYNKEITKVILSSNINKRKADDFSLDLVVNKYLQNKAVAGNGYFTYGKIKNANIGYVHLKSFTANGGENGTGWAYDIDKILSELSGCDALIFDLRNNGGGLKATGAIIASAFVNQPITYFYQKEKTGPGHNDFGNPIPLTISPRNNNNAYTKKIALLTNRFSGSGSEHFAQVFKYLPNTVQIGDTTFGCFGDIISVGQLPNGWTFMYPCRLTITPEGECYEGLGVIPDYLVENTSGDIRAGNDKVFNFALSYLKQ